MTLWTEMDPLLFDPTLVRTKKERHIVETARDTLFPHLLPEPHRKPAEPAVQLDGQDELFGGEL